MTIHCDSKDVSLAGTGKLKLPSFWSSDLAAGEFARFEVRLPPDGKFRFVVEGAQVNVVKAARRKIGSGTGVDIAVDYVNLLGGPSKRLARFAFCGVTRDANGAEIEVVSQMVKFLP